MFIVIMLGAASIDGHLSSLVACHCTDLYLFNLFVYLANKLSLSLSLSYLPTYLPNYLLSQLLNFLLIYLLTHSHTYLLI